MSEQPATSALWSWPGEDYAVLNLDELAVTVLPYEGRRQLLAFELTPAAPLRAAPAAQFVLHTREQAMLARAHYIACRHLHLRRAWVRLARHTHSPGELVCATHLDSIGDAQPVTLSHFCDVERQLAQSDEVLQHVLLDFVFGGMGQPSLALRDGVLLHDGRLWLHVPVAMDGERWKSAIVENPSARAYAAQIADVARRWGSEAIPLRARLLRDEAWLEASALRGQLRPFARMLTDSMLALAALFAQAG